MVVLHRIMNAMSALVFVLAWLACLDTTITITQALSHSGLMPRRTALGVLPTLIAAPAAVAAAEDNETTSSVILGTYTDPINHPGGTRTIALTGTALAGFELAEITGGGGRGEPKQFTLPAMISKCPRNNAGASICITIDFSPKGGPRDFTGYWDADKQGIRFPADGNFWPKVSSP